MSWNIDILRAALWPLGIVTLTILICLPFSDYVGFGHYRDLLPFFQSVPEPYYDLLIAGLLIVTSVAAGSTLNLVAALGQELLWRGYPFDYWKDLSAHRRDPYIGLLW